MGDLSVGAWIFIGLVIILFVTTNLGLWAAWRMRKDSQQHLIMKNIVDNLRNPWGHEDRQLQDLSQRVEELKKSGDLESGNENR